MEEKKPIMGAPITLEEAQGMIEEYEFLNNSIEAKIRSDINLDQVETEKVNVFKEKGYNAFVFTKDLIMRFFDGSEEDSDHNPQASNYLLVILGAHKEKKVVNEEDFEAGSFTVLTAGCIRRTEIEDKKEVVKFYPLSTPKPANEYPPRTIVRLKPEGVNKFEGNGFEYFKVIE